MDVAETVIDRKELKIQHSETLYPVPLSGRDTDELPCAIDNVHHNICDWGRLHGGPASRCGGQDRHGFTKNRRRAYLRDCHTGKTRRTCMHLLTLSKSISCSDPVELI